MMTDSMRTQDTLHNAVLAVRPVMFSTAISRQDSGKGEVIDEFTEKSNRTDGNPPFTLFVAAFPERHNPELAPPELTLAELASPAPTTAGSGLGSAPTAAAAPTLAAIEPAGAGVA